MNLHYKYISVLRKSTKKIKAEKEDFNTSIRNQSIPFQDITWKMHSIVNASASRSSFSSAADSPSFNSVTTTRRRRSPNTGSVIDLRTDSDSGSLRDNSSVCDGTCHSLQGCIMGPPYYSTCLH